MKKYILYINLFILAFGATMFSLSLLPFELFVRVDDYRAIDACIGDEVIVYASDRTPIWGMSGTTYAQIVRFDGELVIETTIKRGSLKSPITFSYEPDTYSVSYETRWFESDGERYYWETPGTYGANEWLTVYPLPFLPITTFNDAKDTMFNVTHCD